MPKVTPLKVAQGFNSQVVEHLTDLLDRARAGEITELVCVYKVNSKEYEHCWSGCEDLHELVGRLERIKHLMLRRMDIDCPHS
jgi:hypothetical protein